MSEAGHNPNQDHEHATQHTQRTTESEDGNADKTEAEEDSEDAEDAEVFEGYSMYDSDSEAEFAMYKSDPEDAEEEKPKLSEGVLPRVINYELDLPKGKRVRSEFDRSVAALLSRIVRSKY